VNPASFCPQIRAIRAQVNTQITALEAAVAQSLSGSQRDAALARLEAARAQANTAIDRVLAAFC
jgi:hypothetical protein